MCNYLLNANNCTCALSKYNEASSFRTLSCKEKLIQVKDKPSFQALVETLVLALELM